MKKIIRKLDKPLGLCISPYMTEGVIYKSSHPKTLWQALRLWFARRLIILGYRLLLRNGKTWLAAGSAKEYLDFRSS